jgi:hypothetical protein
MPTCGTLSAFLVDKGADNKDFAAVRKRTGECGVVANPILVFLKRPEHH